MKKVFETIEKFQMLKAGDQITVGVSGGADSVCLLFVLKQYAALHPKLCLSLKVVHVEHGIRGTESLQDAAFVRELCGEWGIPFQCVRRDVAGLAAKEKLTVEEAGRKVRYEAFEKAAGQDGKIAVAHNAQDQAETILWNLARGSGLAGICGMRPVRGKIIRPLLFATREEIEAFLMVNGLSWRTDSTNLSTDYTRNKLRQKIIPALREVNPRSVEHIGSLGERMGHIFDYLEKQGRDWLLINAAQSGKKISFPTGKFQEADPVLQDWILFQAVSLLGAGRKDFQKAHFQDLKALAGRQSGRKLTNLPGGLAARREGEQYILEFRGEACGPFTPVGMEPVKVPVPGEACAGKYHLCASLEPVTEELRRQKPWIEKSRNLNLEEEIRSCSLRAWEVQDPACPGSRKICKKEYTKWLDYGTIKDTIELRSRNPGDYLTIAPDCGRKKLKQHFIDEKIPAGERDQVPLLADGSHILWVVGGRISEACKITAQTKMILKIQIWEEDTMEDKIRVLVSEEEVDTKIAELGKKISRDYAGEAVHLICVLKGGVFFTCELAKRITVPVSLDFMSVSSYGSGTESSGVVRIVKDLDEPLDGKNVLIVEDIIDSGRTLSYLIEILKKRNPKSLALCTLLDKPERRVKDVKVDYVGFNIPDEFVVGYGLDYDQKYRNLPYIGVVEV